MPRLVVTAQLAGYLVGVLLFVGAGEQDLAPTQGEASGERRPAFKVLRSASLKGRAKIGRFMSRG